MLKFTVRDSQLKVEERFVVRKGRIVTLHLYLIFRKYTVFYNSLFTPRYRYSWNKKVWKKKEHRGPIVCIRCSPRSMWHVTLEFSPKVDSSRIFEFTRFSPIFTFDLSPSKGRCKSIDENLQFRLEISLISNYPEMFQFLLQPPSENSYIFQN